MNKELTLNEIIEKSFDSSFYSKERKEEIIKLIMNDKLKDALNNSEENEVYKFFQFMNISPSDKQITSYLEKNYPTLIKIEGIDIFIAKEMLREEITTFRDVCSFKTETDYNIDNSFFLKFEDIISDIKKHAMSRLKSGTLRLSKGKEDSLFRHVDEYKEKIVDEINLAKLSRTKYLIYKLKNTLGFKNK